MVDDKTLLETCLKTSGSFENGKGASYDAVTGNFDGQGISCGILQWNAGQGTLQHLVINIGTAMGWDKAQTFFKSDIHQFAMLGPQDAIQWCVDHYLAEGSKQIDPDAKAVWQTFLTQPESIAAQVALASNSVLAHAKRLVAQYCPDYTDRVRPYAFMFDVSTQSGGMAGTGHRVVAPIPSGQTPDVSDAINFAGQHDVKCAGIWEAVVQNDNLACLLLHYGYARALFSEAAYQWDACSRRGTIACRSGVVHAGVINLTNVLD